jgi:hypothetical protein
LIFKQDFRNFRQMESAHTRAEMLARAEIIWVSRNRTISLLRFFEAIRRWLVDYLTCVRLWLYVKYLKMKPARKIKNGCFFSPGWNYLWLHAAGLSFSPSWNFSPGSSNRAGILVM